MVKTKSAETLSLDIHEQRKVSKETNKLKKQIETGTVTIKEKRKEQKTTAEQKRGLLYISHLPHGFYEAELKGYFQQFGKVTNVKVCRSNKTGNSKGFGYVEFSHPEVAKIAAETMNNYLMFKKRVTAEYVPYEKRPKSIFLGKSSNAERYSSKVRREKQYQKNVNVDEKVHAKRVISRVSKLNKKLQRLENVGIKTTFKPLDVTLIKQESSSEIASTDSSSHNLRNSKNTSLASDIKVEIPLKKSKRSLRSLTGKASSPKLKSLSTTASKNKLVLAKSLDSVKAVLSKNSKKFTPENIPTKKKPKEPVTDVGDVKKTKKKHSNLKGISKKTKKAVPLNANTVRKIARDLIRKKGNSLLNYQPVDAKETSKKKIKK